MTIKEIEAHQNNWSHSATDEAVIHATLEVALQLAKINERLAAILKEKE